MTRQKPRNRRFLISLLLSVVMVVTMLPVFAFAETPETPAEEAAPAVVTEAFTLNETTLDGLGDRSALPTDVAIPQMGDLIPRGEQIQPGEAVDADVLAASSGDSQFNYTVASNRYAFYITFPSQSQTYSAWLVDPKDPDPNDSSKFIFLAQGGASSIWTVSLSDLHAPDGTYVVQFYATSSGTTYGTAALGPFTLKTSGGTQTITEDQTPGFYDHNKEMWDALDGMSSTDRAAMKKSTEWITSADSSVKAKAASLTAGCTTDRQKAKALYKYVVDNIYYDYDDAENRVLPTYWNRDAASVLSEKYAVCEGIASLYAAFLRSCGIPAMKILGYAGTVYDAGASDKTLNHAWVCAYFTDDNSWHLFDPTWDRKNTYEKVNGEGFVKIASPMTQWHYFDFTLGSVSVNRRFDYYDSEVVTSGAKLKMTTTSVSKVQGGTFKVAAVVSPIWADQRGDWSGSVEYDRVTTGHSVTSSADFKGFRNRYIVTYKSSTPIKGKILVSKRGFSKAAVCKYEFTPKGTTLASLTNTASGVKVSWKKNSSAAGYRIYRSANGGKSFSAVKTLSGASKTAWTDTTATKAGAKYMYKVALYTKKKYSGTYFTDWSARSKALTTYRVKTPSTSLSKGSGSLKVSMGGKPSTYGGTEYQVLYKVAGGSWQKVSAAGASKTISGLKHGKVYYVRVRASRTVGGTKYIGAWSTQKSIRVK